MPDLSWLPFGLPALMAGAFLLSRLRRRHRRLQLWERSTKALVKDSAVETTFLTGRAQVTARSGPNQVRITDARGQDREALVEIEGPEGFSILKLRRQDGEARAPEIRIGDESFDHQLVIEGPVLEVGARLDERMRRRLLSAVSGCSSLEIGGGRLRAEVPDDELRRILPILLDIGERLADPVPVERRIAENARRDSFPGVRIFNMLLLARERPGHPETIAVLRDACSDRSPEVRLQAAIVLGDEGRGVLLRLAETSVHDASAAQAVLLLGSTLPFETLQEILARAVRSFSKRRGGLLRTANACMEELGRRGAAAVGVLAQVMTEQKESWPPPRPGLWERSERASPRPRRTRPASPKTGSRRRRSATDRRSALTSAICAHFLRGRSRIARSPHPLAPSPISHPFPHRERGDLASLSSGFGWWRPSPGGGGLGDGRGVGGEDSARRGSDLL